MTNLSLAVTGMKCGGCSSGLKTKLEAVDGVHTVEASHKDNSVDVNFDEKTTDEESIKQFIEDAGYSVE